MKKKRTTKSVLRQDPVVNEVRKARALLWKQGGGTVKGYIELVHKRTAGVTTQRPRRRRAS